MLKYYHPSCSNIAKKYIETGLTIIDLKGSSTKLMTSKCYNFVQLTSQIC